MNLCFLTLIILSECNKEGSSGGSTTQTLRAYTISNITGSIFNKLNLDLNAVSTLFCRNNGLFFFPPTETNKAHDGNRCEC